MSHLRFNVDSNNNAKKGAYRTDSAHNLKESIK